MFMAMSVWWMALDLMKAEWSFVQMESGGQCVMITGTTMML